MTSETVHAGEKARAQDSTAGTGEYEVEPGDCMASVAAAHGFLGETLWNLPENAELKRVRKDPNVLLPGDRVHIPKPRPRWEDGPTDQIHRFKRKGVPSSLHVVLVDDEDHPLANQPYTLNIDGTLFAGVTDGDGAVRHPIPPGARRGILRVGPEDRRKEYFLDLGHMDPVETIRGLQGRLRNLGYYAGPINGEINAETRSALLLFQERYKLPLTGEFDAATQSKLKEVFGC